MARRLIGVLDDYNGAAEASADWRHFGESDVRFFRDHVTDRRALIERLLPFDIIVIERERTPFPRWLIEALPQLRLLVATGPVNWSIDYDAARERGVVICGTEARQDLAPELTIGLMLALARRIVAEDRSVRDGRWLSGLGTSLRGKTLGILGLGRTGRAVAELARPFGMEIQAWSANLTADAAAAAEVRFATRDQLLANSDIITLHVVLSERTRGMIGFAELEMMKPSALLINTSRGPLVDEPALVDALSKRRIAGAALDVFECEPLRPDHPLLALDNVVVTPHIGYLTDDQCRLFYSQVVENILAFEKGEPIRLLDPP
jgi:phosphoglycerate dehydrogenase-like enzyme